MIDFVDSRILVRLLGIKTAVLRDNDGDYEKHCVEDYANYKNEHMRVFADTDPARSTFEICFYQDNKDTCDALFLADRVKLSVQEYMLHHKADAAFELLDKKQDVIVAPAYIKQSIGWIRA
jgi:putative ATP-dependent endonuclease of OLD family